MPKLIHFLDYFKFLPRVCIGYKFYTTMSLMRHCTKLAVTYISSCFCWFQSKVLWANHDARINHNTFKLQNLIFHNRVKCNSPIRHWMIAAFNGWWPAPFLLFFSFPIAQEAASVAFVTNMWMAALMQLCQLLCIEQCAHWWAPSITSIIWKISAIAQYIIAL